MSVSMKMLTKLLLVVLVKVLIYMDVMPEMSLYPGHEQERPSAAVLTEIVSPLQTMGNWMYYGNLVIQLPEGVTATLQRPESGEQQVGDVIDLEGLEDKPLAPRIWITHYRADCQSEWEMVSLLLDLLPDTTLRFTYRDSDKRVNLFTYTSGYKNGYILNREDDLYLVEELTYGSEDGFRGLLDNKSVRWKSGHEAGDRYNKTYFTVFDKLHIGKDSFLALRYTTEDNRRWITLIRDEDSDLIREGNKAAVYQKIEIAPIEFLSEEQITYKDYNFDGYPDINISWDQIYLWNPDEKQYVEAQVPEEFLELRSEALFSDTEIIWGYDSYSVGFELEDWCSAGLELENWYSEKQVESLWKWEGDTLVKERECTAQIGIDTVEVQAYDAWSGEKMFDQTFPLEEYQKGNTQVQKLYERFYDKMVPAETFARSHRIDYGKEDLIFIPKELLNIIMKAMREGTELETLKPMVNDRELSEEEVLSIAKDNIDLRQTVMERNWSGAYLMVTADGDNDGIMDIIARESYGGSDGASCFVFYQGQEDGSFRRTDALPGEREEFGMLEYDGRNYLFRTLFDYEKKIYNGISITCYKDGKCVEQAELMLVPKHYQTTLAECTQERYKSYAEQIAVDSLTYKAVFEEEENMLGSSEEKLPDFGEYQCDLNNDGIVDKYEKVLWQTSSINVRDYLHFDGEGKVAETVNDVLSSLEGTPIMMWIDAVQDKNVINVLSQTGLEDVMITGFLVSGSSYEQLYAICVDATYDVSMSRTR